MEWIWGLLQTMVVCGTLLLFAFLGLLALPQSKLRDFLMQFLGWVTALFCTAYCLSPVDVAPEMLLGPFGLVDDLGAAAVGIYAAVSAYQAGQRREA